MIKEEIFGSKYVLFQFMEYAFTFFEKDILDTTIKSRKYVEALRIHQIFVCLATYLIRHTKPRCLDGRKASNT